MNHKHIRAIGYACINTELKKSNIYTNRTVRKASATLEKISELSIQNLKDLKLVLKWNHDHGIKLFRMSSDVIPWGNKIDIYKLPNFNIIQKLLQEIGELCNLYDGA